MKTDLPVHPHRIVVVDDHTVSRAGIVYLLSKISTVTCVGEAWDRPSAVAVVAAQQPDLVLMDIKLGETNGIALTRELRQQHPDLRVMAVTMCDELEYIVQMEVAGAQGYLLKTCTAAELQEAIVRVMSGRKAFSSELTEAFLRRGQTSRTTAAGVNGDNRTRSYRISRREKEIIACVSKEMSNKQIADVLFISPRTVENHKRNLFQKLGVKNSVGLLRKSLELNLI